MFQRSRTRLSSLLFSALILLSVAGLCVATFEFSVTTSLREIESSADQRLDLYASGMNSELTRFSSLPDILGLSPAVVGLLHTPNNPQRVLLANQYLAALSARTSARVIYILNNAGQVVATSNWQRADSYLGENDAFRPYFQQAIHGEPSRFFGIGTTRGEPGYYLSQALFDGTRLLGVAVVKISLADLEQTWANSRALVWVSDENRVIILSSRPQWKFATVGELSPEQQRRFELNRQYNRLKLTPLKIDVLRQLGPRSQIVRWSARPGVTARFLAQTRALPGSHWRLSMLLSLAPVYILALSRAALAGVLAVLLLTALFLLNERRRRLREKLAAREALQQAYQELEHKVLVRTADLSAANRKLQEEITERTRAEAHLRQTQAELLQAGKLAAIGQLSTQIAHELNQPLAALCTLSANSVKYLARGDFATASANLDTIGHLVERMGKITGSLRSFARKSNDSSGRAHLGHTLDLALTLFEQRLDAQHVVLLRKPEDEDLLARCDANRLEQVLVNLLANALDALQDQPGGRIEILCRQTETALALSVRDNGPGLSEQSLAHLFEPFFTTKPTGIGLGLGLTLSASIMTEAGGALGACNHPDGGAMFTLTLPLALKEPSDV